MMTKEQKRVLRLNKKLPSRIAMVDEIKYNVIDREWDNHHYQNAYLTEAVKQYQVIRCFAIEVEPNAGWEYDYAEKHKEDTCKHLYDEDGELIENFYDAVYEMVDDPDEEMYEFEIMEYRQAWINTQTMQVTLLGKPDIHGDGCCNDHIWQLIDPNKLDKITKPFYNRFKDFDSEGFVHDLSIQPALAKRGWEPIDAWDWYYGCGGEDRSDAGNIMLTNDLVRFYTTLMMGTNPIEQELKMYGLQLTAKIHSIGNNEYREHFTTACKIANRHHYKPEDLNLWYDTIEYLHKLHKDVHNPHYVCPEDLHAMHDQLYRQVNKENLRIWEMQKRQKQLELEKKNKEAKLFAERFFNLILKDENITIRTLTTAAEYQAEGNAMHHCVAGYFGRLNSLILSARNKHNKRLATIEVNLAEERIVQIRGLQNSRPAEYEEIERIILKGMSKIRKRKNKKLPKAA